MQGFNRWESQQVGSQPFHHEHLLTAGLPVVCKINAALSEDLQGLPGWTTKDPRRGAKLWGAWQHFVGFLRDRSHLGTRVQLEGDFLVPADRDIDEPGGLSGG